MKVYIGPYHSRWVSYVHDKYMDKKYGRYSWKESTTIFEKFLEKLEDGLQWVYNHSINLILDKRSHQTTKIRVDGYDIWSMDNTLAQIVHPMLLKLKDAKHGAPYVADEDVPVYLRATPKKDEYDLDDNHFKRWDWVLDEMIFAFAMKKREDWESDFYKYEHFEPIKDSTSFSDTMGLRRTWSDDEGRKACQKRISNGLLLFGKYYEALWD